MYNRLHIPMNLQYFAEGDNHDNIDDINSDTDSNTDSSSDTGLTVEAFAEIISDKDKKLDELENEIAKLKKSNAELLVRVSTGNNSKPFDMSQAILGLDTRIIK